MDTHPHIIVISHRRSGTHFLIDAIRNNFPVYKDAEILTFRQLIPGWKRSYDIGTYQSKLKQAPCILKSHFLPEAGMYFPKGDPKAKLLDTLMDTCPKFYIQRDGRDVMVSLYRYLKTYHQPTQQQNFSDFLKSANHFGPSDYSSMNRPQFWAHHVKTWTNFPAEIVYLSFADLIQSYSRTLDRIALTLQWPVQERKWKDVRLKPVTLPERFWRKIHQIFAPPTTSHSTVLFNEGGIGTYRSYFTEDDLTYFDEQVNNILQ